MSHTCPFSGYVLLLLTVLYSAPSAIYVLNLFICQGQSTYLLCIMFSCHVCPSSKCSHTLCSCTYKYCCFSLFKTTLMDVFTLTMDQITMSNVKQVACSDERTENYHPLNPTERFISQFTLLGLQPLVFGFTLSPLINLISSLGRELFSVKKALINCACYLPSNSKHTRLVTSR